MVSLGIDIGSNDGITHQIIFDWVSGLIKMSDLVVGSIDIQTKDSQIEIHQSKIDYVISAMEKNKDLGRIVEVNVI